MIFTNDIIRNNDILASDVERFAEGGNNVDTNWNKDIEVHGPI